MTVKVLLRDIIFLAPVLVTYLLYLDHNNGDGSGLVLYGRPPQELGFSLFVFQTVFSVLFLTWLHLRKKKLEGPFIFMFKMFLFLVSLGVPIFINDWLYCSILCYILTFLYIVVAACILFITLLFLIYRKFKERSLGS
jgi:hypothetical protein